MRCHARVTARALVWRATDDRSRRCCREAVWDGLCRQHALPHWRHSDVIATHRRIVERIRSL